ncbi:MULTISPECIES: relaxase/mobilization nuclease domain-containing protein [Gordonia]|uniref:MobA/VirD2-like nuclease domain-containing protein n=1 Tax=Gordonia sihwensis NBRC 108236 TaxID=1223544 RepID=L7LN55_9ACTN|nr:MULTISPECIES: relaxase/mobilization nuclease domain-containing protein [Gordonia]WFN95112.1 relaxase/mobilization nuclease domain-containing protein [Gordonia sihwensis]GAC62329.1 hypothetical protein GSI01S_33_00150 [Gordonia sihwensis NBRC 108236]
MIPAISSGARMYGLVSYLAGPGKANEHENQHVLAASSSEVFYAGGAGAVLDAEHVHNLAATLDEARVVFGAEVVRRDNRKLAAARERGLGGRAALAEASIDENVWHCSLSLPPEAGALDDAQWSSIVHEFMEEMGFDDPDHAQARWVAIRHGVTKNGGDHVHIAASRVRDDGSVVQLFRPHPERSDRKEGDWPRAQRVCRALEAKHGLEVLSGGRDMPTRGTAHAQSAHADKAGRPEAPSAELARRVRAAAVASESEAEFVRLVRADGLIIRPAHYDKTDPKAVTGFSVGLPASEYANRHGKPIMHGGKKLGEDLSLPRLRERWIDDKNARADARSAWEHASRNAAPSPPPPPRGEQPVIAQLAAVDDRLRSILRPLAQSSATEADYVRAVRAHRDVLIRPRFARGSTTEVTGYSVALRPSLAADSDGKPAWRSAGYLADELKLSSLRQRWPGGTDHQKLAAAAWRRADVTPVHAADSRPAGPRAAAAAEAANRWERRVNSVSDRTSKSWHTAAGDTAAAVGAAARHMGGADARDLNRLADALSGAASERRSTGAAGSRAQTRSAVARVAATMIAGASNGDDTTLLWMAVTRQMIAASRAIAEAMAAQGHLRQARRIRAASAAVDRRFADRAPSPAANRTRPAARRQVSAGPPIERPRPTPRSNEGRRGFER